MNERIKEFRFMAAEYANEQKPLGLMKWNEIRDAKFAELIVRECMMMSDELKAQYLKSRKSALDLDEKDIYAEGAAACGVLKYKMKNHFGIE